MTRIAQALVIFLLVAGALLVVVPTGVGTAQAQTGTTHWKGTLDMSETMQTSNTTAPLSLSVSWPLNLTVGSDGQITGESSGSLMVNLTGSCSGFAYYVAAFAITGTGRVNESAQLSFGSSTTLIDKTTECDIGSNTASLGPITVDLVDGFSRSYPISQVPGACDTGVTCTGDLGITLHSEDYTTVSCSPDQQVVSRKADCRVEVFGNSPTGTATLSPGPDLGLSQTQCSLSPDLVGSFSTCQFWALSDAKGNFTVTANYQGDSSNPPTEGSTSISFASPGTESNLTLSCEPLVSNNSILSSCTAGISAVGHLLSSGNVTWRVANPGGVLSGSTCEINNGQCEIVYFQANASQTATITASYAGNSTLLPSNSTVSIAVLRVGTTIFDQRQSSGFVINVTGVADAIVNASSTYYYSQPNGTGTPPFTSDSYYDLKVLGGVTGQVQICHYGADVNASTSLDYYLSGTWTAAADIVATEGVSVCGDIPSSALSGTPLDIGEGSGPALTATSTPTSVAASTAAHSQPGTASSTTSGGGGSTGLSYPLLAASAFAVVVVALYLMVRRRRKPGP